MGSGPYNVPITITGASQISNVAVTVTYNPAVLRMRAVAEGSFMRTGGVNATFTQSPDANAGRVDIAIVRAGDMTGVAGTGLLAALLFEPVAPGQANLTRHGDGDGPGRRAGASAVRADSTGYSEVMRKLRAATASSSC